MNTPPNREVAIFSAALELPASERAAYLQETCADDPALRVHLEALLGVHEKAITFLEIPARGAHTFPHEAGISGTLERLAGTPAEKAGDHIGRYKLLEQIGEGGCGVVYMAEQEEPVRRRVALKVIKLGMDTKQVIARFEAERQALALMEHPNIAKVFDAGATETGRPFFVMELVKGIPITRYCDETHLTTERRLRLFVQVCQAIQHAHQKGVIHRDIKPSNILIADHDGLPVPKIIDFGIAKATTDQRLSDKTFFTSFEQFIGTPAYMSPEQAKLSGLDIDTRSDIYSLGVLLYELLTGKTPFDVKRLLEAGLDEVRRIIREEEPLCPSTRLHTMDATEQTTVAKNRQSERPKLVHLIRGDLDWIVMKALEKDRARRYETANGLAMDVQRFLEDEPVIAAAPRAGYKLRKFVRRHQGAVMAAGLVLLALLGGIGGTTWGLAWALQQQREAQRQAKIANQTTEFLTKMFQSIDPEVTKQREITVREVLDGAGRTVGTSFPREPLVELPIRTTIAYIYEGVGRPDLALPHAQAELQLAAAIHGTNDHPEVYGGLHHVASCLKSLGRDTEALPKYEAALEMLQRIYKGQDQPVVAWRLNEIAFCLDDLGRFAEGFQMHNAALEMQQRIYKGDEPDVVESLRLIARCLNRLGRTDEALPKAEAALEMCQRVYKGDNLPVAFCLDVNAECLKDLGRSAEALPKYEAAYEVLVQNYHGDHAELATSLNHVAECLDCLGRSNEALLKAEAAFAMRLRVYKGDHPNVVRSLQTLAGCLEALSRPTEAIEKHREALAVTQRMLEAQPSSSMLKTYLAETHRALGDVLASSGDAEGALKNYRAGLEAVEAIPSVDNSSAKAAALHRSLRADLGREELEILVLEVLPGGQGEKIRLRNGDVITRYAGQKITASGQLTQLVASNAGPEIGLEVRRDGQLLAFKLSKGKLGVRLKEKSISDSSLRNR